MIPGRDQGEIMFHRDFHENKGYLYMVADEGNSSLQIADIRNIASTGKAPVVYDSNEYIIKSHNIFIDSSTNVLYACGVSNEDGKQDLSVFSLENPKKPEPILNYELHYFHDIYVRNGIAFGNCGNDGLFVIDFSQPKSPKIMGKLTSYPDKGFNHSGWTSENGDYYFLADENHGYKIKSLDASDVTDIKTIKTFGSDVDPNSMPHNLIVKGNFLYVAYYHDGFYVFNIKAPQNPTIAGYYDTYIPSDHDSFKGAWGVYPFLPSGIVLVSDLLSGLYIFDVSEIITNVEETSVSAFSNKNKYLIQYNNATDKIVLINRLKEVSHGSIQIIDQSGKVVLDTNHQFDPHGKKEVSVNPNLEKGVYFVRIFNNEYSQSQKIVKVN